MFVSDVQPAWQSALSLECLQNFQGLNRQVPGLSDSEGQMNLLWMNGLTSVSDATSVIWFVPLE